MFRFTRFPSPSFRRIRHILVVWVIETIALLVLEKWLPGLTLSSGEAAILGVAAIGLLNAVLRPILLYLTITITVLTFGLLSFLLNVVIVILAAEIVPGFSIANNGTAILVVLGITLINTLVTNLLSLDENDSYYRSVILRMQKGIAPPQHKTAQGLIILQLDGLAKEILDFAIDSGYMPTLKKWQSSQEYKIQGWDCGLPSQTSASQSTIIYGKNEDIPAFRWYEKENQKLIVSNHLNDTALLEKRFIKNDSLLSDNASSVGNMFSGGAIKSAITMSQIYSMRSIPTRTGYLYNYFLNPYNFTRTLFLMIVEFFRELFQSLKQYFQKRPKIRRGLLFAIERTISAILLRDISTHLVIEDMFHGYKTIYCTYVGYDVVAHHAGIKSPSALGVLRGIDKQINRIHKANRLTKRDYHIVLLSDHGQTQGLSYRQRYKTTLEQTIHDMLSNQYRVVDAGDSKEIKGYVNSILIEALKPYERMNHAAKKLYLQIKQKTNEYNYFDFPTEQLLQQKNDIVVCTSGNLALVYFNFKVQPLTLEEIALKFPHFVQTLIQHPGIGFVMANTQYLGPIVFGADGIRYLDSNQIEGQDPLRDYGKHASYHLKKLIQQPHCGDLVINSKYDPSSEEAPAFEDLLGHHGGLGGFQTHAFLAYPAIFTAPSEIVDAEDLHHVLKSWQTGLYQLTKNL
jgi:putative membrane protein